MEQRARAVRFAVGFAIQAHQFAGGSIVQLRVDCARQLGENGFGKLFAQLHAPLVKAVDAPNHALGEDLVFIHGNQAAHVARGDFIQQDNVGGAVAAERFMRHKRFDMLGGHALRLQFGAGFGRRFAAHKGFGLGEHVAEQDFVMPGQIAAFFQAGDEVYGRDVRALVQQLEKGMLPIDARFAPDNRTGFGGDGRAVHLHLLAVGFHV